MGWRWVTEGDIARGSFFVQAIPSHLPLPWPHPLTSPLWTPSPYGRLPPPLPGVALEMVLSASGVEVTEGDIACGSPAVPTILTFPLPYPARPPLAGLALEKLLGASDVEVTEGDIACGSFFLLISCDAKGSVTGL
ncbi:unnamed protein product [Closterium sp. Naga37s-1]|nr:unnamed protein product [Closterium sp. Naga37s-1]